MARTAAGFIFDIDGTLVDSNDLLTVGDTPYDILAAHRVALAIVALRCGGFPDDTLSKAEFLFDHTHELLARLDQIDQYFQDE